MGRYITISTKVKKEIWEEAKRLNINISSILRKALENEIHRKRLELINRLLDDLKPELDKIDIPRVVRHIRKDRETR